MPLPVTRCCIALGFVLLAVPAMLRENHACKRPTRSSCADKTVNNFFMMMMNSVRGWDKGCHGEVKCFAGIKTSCFQTTAVSWQPQLLHQRSCTIKNGWRKFWLVSTDERLSSCLLHAFLVTLDKPPGIYVQSGRRGQPSLAGQRRRLGDVQATLTRARQETGQMKGQNSLIKVTPQITANQAENFTQRKQTFER